MLEPSKNRANQSNCWKHRNGCEKKLIFCAIAAVALVAISAALYFGHRSSSTCGKILDSDDECRTKSCVKAASTLLDFIDLKENPCENFYKFVCGSYYKNAVKKNTPSPFSTVNAEFRNELKAIVVDDIKKKDAKSVVTMKKFYQECMDDEKVEGDRTFLETIGKLGGWPLLNQSWNNRQADFNWDETFSKSTLLGLPALGFFSLKRVETAKKDTVLHIEGAVPDSAPFLFKFTYDDVMGKIARIFDENVQFSSEENGEVLTFFNKLKELQKQNNVKEDLKGILKYLLTFNRDGREEVKTVGDLVQTCPQFPWLKMFNSMSNNQLELKSKVAFPAALGKYCTSLDKLLASTKPQTIQNYFIWTIFHGNVQFLSRPIRKAYRDIKDGIPRYEMCFSETDARFKYVKEAVYIRKKTVPKVVEQLGEMLNLTIETFKEHLEKCTWMDDETKSTAIKKAQNIENIIGGFDELYDVQKFDETLGLDGFDLENEHDLIGMVQKTNARLNKHFWDTLYAENPDNWQSFFDKAMKVNAFFISPLNTMVLPAPILSSIFYDHKMPAFMNYGSLGRIVGHEIMHGFEESGREILHPNGHFYDWWSKSTLKSYKNSVKCVIDDYEKLQFRYKLNGTLTLDENVSDFVGIDVAYESYLKYTEKHGAEKSVPGIPLSPEQLFWVQTGTWLCFRKLDDDDVDYEEEDEHAIPKFRVEGGARNSYNFAKDFQCPEGSYMNPKEKCRVL